MKRIKRMKHRLDRASPTILTAMAVVGVIELSVSLIEATVQTMRLLHEPENQKKSRKELARSILPKYASSALVGVTTIGCIVSSHRISRSRQIALGSAYMFANGRYLRYRDTLADLHGKEADAEVKTAMIREHCAFHATDLDVPDRQVLFYDSISDTTFLRYEREVLDAEYHINRNFVLAGAISVNNYLEFLGLPTTDYGEELGWSISEGYVWIDFEHQLIRGEEGKPDTYEIVPMFPPMPWDQMT